MSKWISINEDIKPKITHGSGVSVLVALDIGSGHRMLDVGCYWVTRGFNDDRITHWMPLPEMPRDGEQHDNQFINSPTKTKEQFNECI